MVTHIYCVIMYRMPCENIRTDVIISSFSCILFKRFVRFTFDIFKPLYPWLISILQLNFLLICLFQITCLKLRLKCFVVSFTSCSSHFLTTGKDCQDRQIWGLYLLYTGELTVMSAYLMSHQVHRLCRGNEIAEGSKRVHVVALTYSLLVLQIPLLVI